MSTHLAERCLLCERALPPYSLGRPRLYDSDECRKADHVLRRMLDDADHDERLADAGGTERRTPDSLRRDAAERRRHVERERQRRRRSASYVPPPDILALIDKLSTSA